MKYLFIFLFLFLIACQPEPEKQHLGFVPIPTGTGFVRVTGGKFDTSATAAIALTSQVSGTLPVANGGTGSTTFSPDGLFFSYAEAAAQRPGTGTSGNFTVGPRFFVSQNFTITGAKWYAPFAATFKVSVWNTAGTRMTSDNVVVGSPGAQTTTFSTPQSITADYNAAYTISVWDTTGISGKYMNESGASNLMPLLNAGFQWSPHLRWAGFYYAAGDAFPTSGAGSEIYAMDPVF